MPQTGPGSWTSPSFALGNYSSLKEERIRKRIYETRDMARAEVLDCIEVFYNRSRRHSHLGGIGPRHLSAPGRETGSRPLE
jgi:putative transposase